MDMELVLGDAIAMGNRVGSNPDRGIARHGRCFPA